MSLYHERIDPCKSCQIFFGELAERNDQPTNFLGNCAEYDVIRTVKLQELLYPQGQKQNHWNVFESSCKRLIKEFHDMLQSLRMQNEHEQTTEIVVRYKKRAVDAKLKTLKFKWNDQHSHYKLIAS